MPSLVLKCFEETVDAGPLCLDDLSGRAANSSNYPESNLVEQYKQIGKVLGIGEASSFKIGVPLLAPTRQVRSRRQRIDCSLEYFLRYNLVGVNTESLNLYIEELEGEASYEALFIPVITASERWACPVIMILCSLVIVLGISFASPTGLIWEGGLSLILSAAFLTAVFFSSDFYRRLSFVLLLKKEARRRAGLTPSDSGNFNAIPTLDAQ